jgi:GNAT superfamily N-acetyltransferase
MLGWPAEMLAAFLEQQRRAQAMHYRAAFADAAWLIVESGGAPVGRLYTDERPASVHLIDIALLPEWRGRGLGGAILADLIADAAARGLAVSLQVEKVNPARRLYERLGFRTLADNGPHDWMERPVQAGP